jgi:galactofuranosylgalactofuranosylrhamnosyl-N-acetylglucosaminyl-diphospho-decaprenol beta-1,5/1,6-galactofuranosyltransferase
VALADGGAQAAAAVRKVRADYRETVTHPAYGAPEAPVAEPGPEPAKPRLVLLKRAALQVLGTPRGEVTIAARHNHWWHVGLFGTAVVTDPSQEGVRLRRRDPAMLRSLAWRGVRVLSRFRRRAPRAQRLYRAAMPELTSRRNWAGLFGVNNSNSTPD